MDTYGDMVTLLLCFFILLYSISVVDQEKWVALVKSMNPEAVEEMIPEQPIPETSQSDEEETGVNTSKFDDLYEELKAAVAEHGLEGKVEVSRGVGYAFISFKDQVFFTGNSSVITSNGKTILDTFSLVLGRFNDVIKEVEVLGYTSQAPPGQPNDIYNDRMLSANRSTEVVAYIQAKGSISPQKLVQVSFGQYRPVASHETTEGRAQNRRVEMIIAEEGVEQKSLDAYYDEIYRQDQ